MQIHEQHKNNINTLNENSRQITQTQNKSQTLTKNHEMKHEYPHNSTKRNTRTENMSCHKIYKKKTTKFHNDTWKL